VHFFALDSEGALSSSSDMAAQQAWLQSQLAASTTPWQVVYLHHAPYSSANHGSNSALQWPFAAWGADAVIAGHDHTYERLSISGIPYFVNGLGGRSIYNFGSPVSGSQVRYNGDYGAMRVSANEDQMVFAFFNVAGTEIDSFVVDETTPSNVPPTADFTFITNDLTASFSDQSTDSDGTVASWSWNFGDGSSSTTQNPSHSYAAAGTYTVMLTVTDDDGDTDSSSQSVTVSVAPNAPPTAAFTFATSALSANFTDASTDNDGSIVSWSWDFNDGSSSTDQNPSHSYAAAGTYNVSLTVTDDDGASSSTSQSVSVSEVPPTGMLDIRITAPDDDVEQALSDGRMYAVSSDLELGDDPSYNGEQVIGLRFQNINIPQGATINAAYLEFTVDETSSASTIVDIQAQAADNAAAFSSTPYDLTDRQLTTASTSWSIPAWNTIGALQQSPDLSAVVQEVVNRSGWSSNNSMVFAIDGVGTRTAESYNGSPASAPLLHVEYTTDGPANVPPAAAFSATTSDLNASFTDSSSDSDGSIASWAWDFGDGNSSTAQNPSHSYAAAGSYTVMLTVTDDDGASDSSSQSVTVTAPPVPNTPPTAAFTVTTSDLSASFTDTSSDSDGSIASWNWDFGDGNSSAAQNPSHSYAAAGSYTVMLTVTDDDGAMGTVSQTVVVSTASFSLPYLEDFADGQAQFFMPSDSTWAVNSGTYEVNSTSVPSLAIFDQDLSGETSLSISAKVEGLGGRWQNGIIIFDYVSPTDYKFAGAFLGADQWRIGHQSGNSRITDAVSYETLDVSTVYDIRVEINGTIATLYADGVEKASFNFGSNLLDGKVGLGVFQAHTQFDDFRLENGMPTSSFGLPYLENFADGQAQFFESSDPAWAVNAGVYEADTAQNPSLAIFNQDLSGQSSLSIAAKVEGLGGSWQNGFIIFDYVSPTDFKFAGALIGADRWVIGHWSDYRRDLARLSQQIDTLTTYNIRVAINGTVATLYADGVSKVSYNFGSNLLDGQVGLGVFQAHTQFDDFQLEQ